MSDVHQLPDPEQVEIEASLWMARLNAEDATAEDRAKFQAWRVAHPVHARVFDSQAQTWLAFAATGPLVRAVSLGQSLNATTRAPVRQRKNLVAYAAAATAAVALAWFVLEREPGNLHQTAIGEHASVLLPDGSTLELNSNSRARVQYTEQARLIRLEQGEAYFKVARDASRPFSVQARGSWVRALGTAFNVYLRSADVRVTVTEGSVRIGSPRAPVEPSEAPTLSAGHEAELKGHAVVVRAVAPAEMSRTESWRSGTAYFDKQPLGVVVDEMNRYSVRHLVVDDQSLRHLLVGGTFRANPQGVDAFLAMLRDGLRLNVREERAQVHIEPGEN